MAHPWIAAGLLITCGVILLTIITCLWLFDRYEKELKDKRRAGGRKL